MFKKATKYSIVAIILLSLGVISYLYYQHQKIYPYTDDAYVQANVVYIAPQVSGKIAALYVHDQQHVSVGQKLFQINQKPFLIAIKETEAKLNNTIQEIKAEEDAIKTAKASVAEREVEWENQLKITARILILVKRGFLSKQAKDIARAKLIVTKEALAAAKSQLDEITQRLGDTGEKNAQIKAAQAELAQAELNLKYATITSPAHGYVVKLNLTQGTQVTAYEQLFVIVKDNLWWVNANFRESELARIRSGQPAKIKIDMYPNITFHGIVHSISAASGSAFSLLPPENATGNWVKVTQRFPIRIYFNKTHSQFPLRVGASAQVTIDTSKRSQ